MRGLDGRPAAIEAVDLTCRAGERVLVRDASLRVMPGELVAVLGPSGSGKTTLLHALAGARAPSAGRVRLGGAEVTSEQLQREVALVPQDDVVHLELTPAQALDAAARLRLNVSRAAREEKVRALLQRLELEACRDVPATRLSGGQRKRLSLALELVVEPGVVVLDEPTANLDPPLQVRLVTHLRRLATDTSRAVLFSTHQLEHLDACHRVVVLRDGRIVFDGTPVEARARLGSDDLSRLLDELPARQRPTVRMWRDREPRRRLRRVSTVAAARQLPALVRREVQLLTADPRRPALLLLQAPLVGLAIAAGLTAPASLLLLLVLAALWCGTSAGVRAIVRERPVLLRERRWGVSATGVLAAKLLVLSALAVAQTGALLGVVAALRDVPGAGGALFAALFATAFAGVLVGVALSAVASSADQANALVPLALIPQVLLAGPLAADEPLARAAGRLTPARWGYDLAVRVAREVDPAAGLVTEDELDARRASLGERERELRERLEALAPPALAPLDLRASMALASLDEGLANLRDEGQRTEAEFARLEARARSLTRRGREAAARARSLEAWNFGWGTWPRKEGDRYGYEWAREQLKTLAEQDLPALERGSDELDAELAAARSRQARLEGVHEDLERRRDQVKGALRGAEDDLQRVERAMQEARERVSEVEALARAIATERDGLRSPVDEGRVVRLERWGGARHDVAALAVFVLLCAGVALAALDRSRAG